MINIHFLIKGDIVKNGGGRPRKSFEDVSYQTRKRRSKEDNMGRGVDQVLLACYFKLKEEGRVQDAQIIKKMRIWKVDGSTKETECYSSVEALAIILDCR